MGVSLALHLATCCPVRGPRPAAIWPRYIDGGHEDTRYQGALSCGVLGHGICHLIAANAYMAWYP
jgi:hypothetical protein